MPRSLTEYVARLRSGTGWPELAAPGLPRRHTLGPVSDGSAPWWKDQLTHIPTYQAVQSRIEGIVDKKYSGWREVDRADLVSHVLEKYLWKFGKENLNEDVRDNPVVPSAWLQRVVTTTAIDVNRKRQVRRDELVDFADPAAQRRELVDALRDLATPSLMAMRGVVAQQALERLAVQRLSDRDLLQWRYIDGDELGEIAERIGTTKEATRKAVQRAVARLRIIVLADDDLRAALFDRP